MTAISLADTCSARYANRSRRWPRWCFPNDANPLGNLLGGRLMHLIDIAGAIAAHRHCHRQVVTASVDHLDFLNPVRLGELIVLEAQVKRAFHTSVEVGVEVFSENFSA